MSVTRVKPKRHILPGMLSGFGLGVALTVGLSNPGYAQSSQFPSQHAQRQTTQQPSQQPSQQSSQQSSQQTLQLTPSKDPLWEVGSVAFGFTQQAFPGASENISRAFALPYVLYRGPLLRIDREAFGLRAIKGSNFELDIGFSGALGSRARDIEARRGMPDLGTLIEFGPRARWNLGPAPGGAQWRLEVPLRGVFDVTDNFSSRGLALEPRIQWNHSDLAGWRLSASAGAILGDRRLTGTFYDVAPEFATVTRPAFEAKAGLIAWRLSVIASHQVSRDWRVFGFARMDSVAGSANGDSPLISRTDGYSGGIGLQWVWMRSERLAAE